MIAARNKLSAFERTVLPAVEEQERHRGARLETFFLDLDKALTHCPRFMTILDFEQTENHLWALTGRKGA